MAGAFAFVLAHLAELQDLSQVAVQVDVEAALGIGGQCDPVDLAPDARHGLGVCCRIGEHFLEIRDFVPVLLGQVRVEPDAR